MSNIEKKNEMITSPMRIMTTVNNDHRGNKERVVPDIWLYLSTVDGEQCDGRVMGTVQIHVKYWTGYHFLSGGRAWQALTEVENWKMGDIVINANNMDDIVNEGKLKRLNCKCQRYLY